MLMKLRKCFPELIMVPKRLQSLFENYLYYTSLELISKSQSEVDALLNNFTHSVEAVILENITYFSQVYKRPFDISYEINDSIIPIAENYFKQNNKRTFR